MSEAMQRVGKYNLSIATPLTLVILVIYLHCNCVQHRDECICRFFGNLLFDCVRKRQEEEKQTYFHGSVNSLVSYTQPETAMITCR